MPIVVGYTNRGHARLAANWIASLNRLGIDERATLYCVNDGAFEVMRAFCDRVGSNCGVEMFTPKEWGNFSQVAVGSVNWGTREFTRMMLARLDLFSMLCKQEPFVPFLHTDIDCAFVRDPFDYLNRVCDKQDLYIQSNRLDFIRPSTQKCEFCCGIQYYRAQKVDLLYRAILWLSRKLLDLEKGSKGSKYFDDEHAMNQSMYEMGYNPGVLPIDLFPTGRNSWDRNPIVVHANWVIGIDLKERKLRNARYWYVDDEMLDSLRAR
jgi:hypothetical protein